MKKVFDELVTGTHTAVLGKTGSGKTSTAKLLIEQVVRDDDARVCILDPIKSDWWGITSSRDGKHAGLPFDILGGPHAHVPITEKSGAIVGELVGKGQIRHSIIDMADFKAGGAQVFFNDFAPALLKYTRGVLYLVLEEAHEFAPKERSGMEGENMNVYYAKKMATAGRSKGLRLVMVSQAVQQLHNRLLGSCETMIAHRFTAPADQVPINKWLSGNVTKDGAALVMREMGKLATGEAYIVNADTPLVRRQFPQITTFDNSATPTNDDEVKVVQAPVDKTKLRQMIGLAVAEAEMNDPALLKAEIANLRSKLNSNTFPSGPSGVEIDAWRHEGWEEGYAKGKQRGFEEGHKHAMEQIGEWERNNDVRIQQLLANIMEGSQDIRELMKAPKASDVARIAPEHGPIGRAMEEDRKEFLASRKGPKRVTPDMLKPGLSGNRADGIIVDDPHKPLTEAERKALLKPYATDMNQPGSAVPKPEGGFIIQGGKRRMLSALAQYPDGLSAKRLGLLIDMQIGSGTWRNYLAELRKREWIVGGGEQIKITRDGLDALGDWDPLPTGRALIAYWSQRLGNSKKREMFDIIVSEPGGITAEGLAKRVDMQIGSGTWRNYMAELRGLGIVTGTKHNLRVAPEMHHE